jgi:NAD(P)-dependent dehydrogenase (short-subunit alcohol dehydrogenase family)
MTRETIETTRKRTAIITGGSCGMGRNTAGNLARRGVDVIFTRAENFPRGDYTAIWRFVLGPSMLAG